MARYRLETPIDGPVIRKVGSRNLNSRSSMLSALSVAADEMPFNSDELYGFVHFRIDTAFKARKRCRWLGGRLYNALTGQSVTYIPLSGTHLRQALFCIGLQPPDQVVVQGRYELRLDYALKVHDALKSKAEADPK